MYKNKLICCFCSCRSVALCILRKLQISGERMEKVKSGKRSGGNIMMPQVNRKNGPTSGVTLTLTHPWTLVMLMFGMKGTESCVDRIKNFALLLVPVGISYHYNLKKSTLF